jgi:hypothetical protein
MFKRHEDGPKGILNDWDMASHLDAAGEIPSSTACHRTGTFPFMARDLLDESPPPHLYRHDLESFFYILIWAAVHFDFNNKRRLPTRGRLASWDSSTFVGALQAKRAFILDYNERSSIFRYIRKDFAALQREWLVPLWHLFQDATLSMGKYNSSDYDDRTYGGRLTFETFMKALTREPRQLKRTKAP